MSYLKWLLKMDEKKVIPKSLLFLEFILIVLFFTTTIFVSTTYDLYDISFESIIIVFCVFMIFNIIIYNKEYKKILKKVESNLFFEKSYSISNSETLEQEKNSLPSVYFYLITIISLLCIEYYDISTEKIIGLIPNNIYFILIFIFLNFLLANDEVFQIKEIANLKLKENKKSNIENYVFEIEEQLKLFNDTSLFKQKVLKAIELIKNIYIVNIETLNRLNFDEKAKSLLNNKNTIIEIQIKEIIYSIIEYNNNKNEEILNNVQKNIEIINSLRN